jgi:hypothetical protein
MVAIAGRRAGAEGRCGAGCGGMDCRNGESQNRAVLRTGGIETRHPRLGAAQLPLGAYWLPQKTKQLQDGGN